MENYKIIIVGAGPAGIGVSMALQTIGLHTDDVLILEKDKVGSTFEKWPAEMKFITPSFIGNQFGATDLNSISPKTSPAFSMNKEHLSGREYAQYLNIIVDHYKPNIKTKVEVKTVVKENNKFILETSETQYTCDFLIWCAGEFQFPKLSPFKGAENCMHNTKIKSYKDVKGDEQLIIGGYESGIDAAINLSKLGKKVIVLDPSDRWNQFSSDPSTILSTYTFERLQNELENGNISLINDFRVKEVIKTKTNFEIINQSGEVYQCFNTPILCTGFSGSTNPIQKLVIKNETGDIKLTDKDESVVTENLFLSGPMVRQNKVIFCFIYKFRQRFPVIAQEIGKRLEIDTTELDEYRKANMFLDDLSCCDEECAC